MKISPLNNFKLYNNFNLVQKNNDSQQTIRDTKYQTYPDSELQQVYFCSKVNVNDEKSRLKHIIEDLWYPFDQDSILYHSNKIFLNKKMQIVRSFIKYEIENHIPKEESEKELEKYTEKEIIKIAQETVKELDKMQKEILAKDIDPYLIYNFKNAINSGNYDLKKVYKEYYQPLNDIKTVDELKSKYPAIQIPQSARENVAKRLIRTLDNNFYEEFDKLFLSNQENKVNELGEDKFRELYPLCEKYMPQNLYDRILHDDFIHQMVLAYIDYKKDGTKLETIPKDKFNISKEEEALLIFDYDEMVITMLKAMCLEDCDLKTITISSPVGKTINPSQIKTPEYKFKQLPPYAINKIFKVSERVLRGMRDYDNFDEQQLRSRLEFYENSNIAQDEKVLECIMKFEYSKLLPEDYKILGNFLRELDAIKDGKQSVDEFLENVKTKDLSPKGQERLNKLERENLEKQIRERQKYEQELAEFRERHSDAVLYLFDNNLTKSAEILKTYYPNKTQDDSLTEILALIENYTDENGLISNPQKLEESIICLDKYNKAKLQDNPIFETAMKFAGNNKIKAGQYIKNFENVLNYANGEINYFDKDLLHAVVDKHCGGKTELLSDPEIIKNITKYLCKYEAYNELSDNDKNTLSEFIKLFDENDETDKAVMKYLVSERYVNEDTNIIFTNNSVEIPVIFAKEAKDEILKRYKYPKCIDYFTAFEYAMTKNSVSGSSGIKIIGNNNDKIRGLEVKISIDKDRLYSSKNDYRFDIYDYYGYHA